MKLTLLCKGDGYHFPPCYMLDLCGFHILLECPLDLSALKIFSPIPSHCNQLLNVETSSDERMRKKQKTERPIEAKDLICAEPWYKMVANLHLWDLSFIDIVLISSPMGMLGLPFLTRAKNFSAKIYATEATTRIGQLLMEDLVAMHLEFKQFFGPDGAGFPKWMRLDEIELLHDTLKDILMGENGAALGGWQPLYSAADVKDCIQKFKTLKYAEEACYNDTFVIKACSSGLEIGGMVGTGDDVSKTSQDNETIATVKLENEEKIISSCETFEEREKIAFICSCAIDSLKQGGSVLIPFARIGIVLQLLEEISVYLESSNLEVPIFMISTVAEELLAYTNIVPEWLCNQCQENLYSGDALFCHVELIKAKKLHVFPAIHSIDFLNFIMNEVAGTLHCVCSSLESGGLVLLFTCFDDGVVIPIHYLFWRLQKIQPLLEILQPKCVLLPEVLRLKLPISESRSHSVLYYYSENETQSIPSSRKDFEISLATNLAFQLRPIMMKQESIAIARLNGKLIVDHGNFELDIVKEPDKSSMRQMSPQSGSLDLNILLAALHTKGINGSLQQEADKVGMIQVYEPEKALIEVHAMHTIVSADDETLAALLFEVVSNVLNGN
ncbi:hypothetical protein IFM89_028096 [Coptis chinensis]|uniref:Beta-Casp domain-containing protein n=1 Tax=Coptis chinensis TaxID=261450 RepID=A0A835HVA4_9MAGN|nr:hypothetical protein IFM89_028096 [Coptis chinensis]